jgi:hypothetical protein
LVCQIIDRAAGCKTHLADGKQVIGQWTDDTAVASGGSGGAAVATCSDPPCFDAALDKFRKNAPDYLKNMLCECLDDFNSMQCGFGIKKACKDGAIPKVRFVCFNKLVLVVLFLSVFEHGVLTLFFRRSSLIGDEYSHT